MMIMTNALGSCVPGQIGPSWASTCRRLLGNALLSIIITYSTIIGTKLLGKVAKSLPGPKTGLQMPYSKNRDHFCCRQQRQNFIIFLRKFGPIWIWANSQWDNLGTPQIWSKCKKLLTDIQPIMTIKQI